MKYIDIYNAMENPLDIEEILDKLAEAYAKSGGGYHGLYSEIIKIYSKDYIGKYISRDKDKFYATAFNKWKNGIVSLTYEEFLRLRERGVYDNRLIKLRNYLMTIPDVATAQKVREIVFQRFEDKELDSAMEDYYWESISFGTSWKHVKSRYLNGKRGYNFEVNHRLYLNLESIDTYKVAYEIMQKCDEHNIPYYFKFDEFGDRDDTLVIYSDTERLPLYINILEEIAREHPEIKQRCKQPPILTGKINGWIGYGAEPEIKNESFNSLRCKCILESFEQEYIEWLKTNKKTKVKFGGQITTIIDLIAKLATEKQVQQMLQSLTGGTEENKREKEKLFKYKEQDLRDSSLLDIIQAKVKDAVERYINNPEQEPETIKIIYGSSIVRINGESIREMKNSIFPYIIKTDSNFRNRVIEQIRLLSRQRGIDISKYCFNGSSKEKLASQDRDNQTISKIFRNISITATKRALTGPRVKGLYETNQSYINYLIKYVKEKGLKVAKNHKTPEGLGMTDEEIKASQIKLGIISPEINPNTTYRLRQGHIVQDLPIYSSEESRYDGVMSEEVLTAQKKIGTYRTLKKGK